MKLSRTELNTSKRKVISNSQRKEDGISKFLEGREIGLSSETGRCFEEVDQKLQGHCADICDVEVVRVLYYSSSGKRNRT